MKYEDNQLDVIQKKKKELRKYYINILKSIAPEIKHQESKAILNKLEVLIKQLTNTKQKGEACIEKNICAFLPKNDDTEIDLQPLINKLYKKKYKIFIPIIPIIPMIENEISKMKILSFLEWHPPEENTKVRYDALGIQQYEHIKSKYDENYIDLKNDSFIMLVPLLAFDNNNYRLGRGGGYYDATINYVRSFNQKVITICSAFREQKSESPLPIEKHDQKIDFMVIPTSI